MTETNVFEQGTPQGTQASTFDTLVGADKKFKTPEELAKAKVESDNFIGQLTGELSELRKELKAKLVQDELLKELGKGNQPQAAQVPPNGTQALAPEELAQLVRNEIQQTKQQDVAQANVLEADQFITGKFGDKEKAKQFIIAKSRDLGISVSWLMDMAAKSPKALYQVLGLDQTTNTETNKTKMLDLNNGVNYERKEVIYNGSAPKEGTKAYFDAIRKENKAYYFSPEVQNKLFKAKKEGIYD